MPEIQYGPSSASISGAAADNKGDAMNEIRHPDNEQLKLYALGRLPSNSRNALIAHLATCKECRALAERLASSADSSPRIAMSAPTGGSPMKRPLPIPATIPQKTVTYHPPDPTRIVAGLELVRELARGGLGVVYLARHPLLNDLRAVKRPQSRDDLENETVLARFRREVRAVGSLRHDHIIRAHDAGVDADGPFLVMEYVDGESLSRLVTRHGRLSVPEACELIRQAAIGLQAASERGLVHRDIKPSNLMLARANSGARLVIIDWGLVKQRTGAGDASSVDGLTRAGSTMGTYDYIAPEQIVDAGDVDIRVDIYSLGATLYCLLAGQPPFSGKSNREKVQAHLSEPFPSLATKCPGIPKTLMAVLGKMVEKEAEKRFATPGEVALQLRPFCCGADSPSLLALLDASPDAPVAPVAEKNDLFSQSTAMGSPPLGFNSPQPPPFGSSVGPQKGDATERMRGVGRLWAVAAGFLVLAAVVTLGFVALRGGKDKGETSSPGSEVASTEKTASSKKLAKSGGSVVLIDENFKSTLQKNLALPDGWIGDSFGVVADEEGRACLEVNKKTGEPLVTLPPLALGNGFVIEGEYILRGLTNNRRELNQTLTLRLLSSKGGEGVPVTINHTGFVAIAGNEPRQAAGFIVPGCANGFWRSVGRRPIKVPMITVRKATQLGHFVDVLDAPAGSGLFEPFTDQILGRALDHTAADRLPGVESMAVVETLCMCGEIARQVIQRRATVRAVVRRQGLAQMVAKASPAVGQQQLAALVQPFLRGRPLTAQAFGRGVDVLGGVVDVEDLVTTAELPRRRVPDPLGTISQDGDRGQVLDLQPGRPFRPLRCELVDGFDGRECHPRRRGGKVALVPFRRRGGFAAFAAGEDADLHVAPASGCVDLGGIGLEFDIPGGLSEDLGDDRRVCLEVGDPCRLRLTRLASPFVADLPATALDEQFLGSGEGILAPEQADQSRGLSCEIPFQAEETVGEVAAQATGPAGEIGAPHDDRSQSGHHRFGRIPLVTSRRPTRAETSGTPFFSRLSARD